MFFSSIVARIAYGDPIRIKRDKAGNVGDLIESLWIRPGDIFAAFVIRTAEIARLTLEWTSRFGICCNESVFGNVITRKIDDPSVTRLVQQQCPVAAGEHRVAKPRLPSAAGAPDIDLVLWVAPETGRWSS
jgi:hypothetical protein